MVINSMWVLPQHRFLISGWRAEMLFGEAEVLVSATHMDDGERAFRAERIAWLRGGDDLRYLKRQAALGYPQAAFDLARSLGRETLAPWLTEAGVGD